MWTITLGPEAIANKLQCQKHKSIVINSYHSMAE